MLKFKKWLELLNNGVIGRDPFHFDFDNLMYTGKYFII